ncbi:MAG TPA: hypothetical protein VN681_11440 [Stellaceae bacterium]|nr:hypothetical protein [Stellaceae bacterium]
MEGGDFGWISLLQVRADFARKAAANARTPEIGKEFEDLAALYQEMMDHAGSGDAAEAKGELLRYLQSRAAHFLREARDLTGKAGDDLKYLAGVFGAEASRVQNHAVR